MQIALPSVLHVANPEQYKLHLACWNQHDQPLDVFVRDRNEWANWNRWRGMRDDFSRPYIFSLIDFYPQSERWLFGGIFRVRSRSPENRAYSYDIELVADSAALVGRLKLALKRPGRAKSVNFENYYERLVVDEVLPAAYTGESFSGFDNIDLSFASLESIVAAQRADWKAALVHAKGIYLVTDTSNGLRYVGSAYGQAGLWSRLECYAGTGHGFNGELTRLINQHGIAYARRNFRFALLEHRTAKTDDDTIIKREGYWKNVLLTRGAFGYNKN